MNCCLEFGALVIVICLEFVFCNLEFDIRKHVILTSYVFLL